MEEKHIMHVIDENGQARDAEILLYFTLNKNGKDYIIYTYHEEEGDLVVVHTSSITKDQDGTIVLNGIPDNEEWTQIKDVMRQVIKENKE